jgi:hypothetical protein
MKVRENVQDWFVLALKKETPRELELFDDELEEGLDDCKRGSAVMTDSDVSRFALHQKYAGVHYFDATVNEHFIILVVLWDEVKSRNVPLAATVQTANGAPLPTGLAARVRASFGKTLLLDCRKSPFNAHLKFHSDDK